MGVCTGFIEPLNLECLFINVFAGNAVIFLFLAFIFIGAMAARFRMRNTIVMLMVGLFSILFGRFEPGLYILTVLLGGIIAYTAIRRVVSRQ